MPTVLILLSWVSHNIFSLPAKFHGIIYHRYLCILVCAARPLINTFYTRHFQPNQTNNNDNTMDPRYRWRYVIRRKNVLEGSALLPHNATGILAERRLRHIAADSCTKSNTKKVEQKTLHISDSRLLFHAKQFKVILRTL
jgi:hypothetical protein